MMPTAPEPAGPPAAGPIERAAEAAISLGHRIAQISIVCMMALITADVIARNAFKTSLLISDEVSGYLLVVMTFFGISYSLRSGSLLRIEFLLFTLPKRLRGVADIFYDLVALIVCLVLLRAMIRFTWITWEREAIAPTLIETPLWIPQLAMPLGTLILVIAFMLELRGGILRLLGRAPAATTEATPHLEISS
jgi:TRAP-type C4-dicarboxylate transport system permease small subunit